MAAVRNVGCKTAFIPRAIAHKTQLRDRLAALTKASGIAQAEALSAGLMLLVDGAFVQRRLYQTHRVNLCQAATMLMRAYDGT
ncbi:hypothetical protein [Altericista sp. CCNU0014]|uniref:hypothetical protein n=1 Tax=Altericista sp. CCNU0014 TaxID=3082949 RepID=UPI00384BAA7A